MHLHDPDRPTLCSQPQILWQGKPVGTVPRINLFLLPDESMLELSIFIVNGHNRAHFLEIEIPYSDLDKILREWLLDPEQTARERFGWAYDPSAKLPAKPVAGGKPELSIEDLL